MDMSFSNQALSVEHLAISPAPLSPKVHAVPESIDQEVGRLKLLSMGIKIDNLTKEQEKYLNSWELGT